MLTNALFRLNIHAMLFRRRSTPSQRHAQAGTYKGSSRKPRPKPSVRQRQRTARPKASVMKRPKQNAQRKQAATLAHHSKPPLCAL